MRKQDPPQSPAALYRRLSGVTTGFKAYTPAQCDAIWPLIQEIGRLKAQKNAIILAHSYVKQDIVSTVADYVGDSLELSRIANSTDASMIVFSAVRFMAETAKILNPDKTVLIPSLINGCSLADSISARDVVALRQQYPRHAFICYINTTAAVKAICDCCVTSSNVYDIVEHWPTQHIYFLPDALMGKNLVQELARRQSDKQVLYSSGTCYVHQEYTPDMIDYMRHTYPEIYILAHPECHPSLIQACDFVGSTSQMIQEVGRTQAKQYFLLTECGLSNRLAMQYPDKRFVGTCTLCRYMKSNTLDQIVTALRDPEPHQIVDIDAAVQTEARACIQMMFDMSDSIDRLARARV